MSPDDARLLRERGISPSAQRVAVASYVLHTEEHPSADEVLQRVRVRFPMVSRATVYNTLHQFTESGLLREVVVGPGRSYFDTNTHAHHHFYVEPAGELVDIPVDSVELSRLPTPPDGTVMDRVDVIIRVTRP